MNNLNNIIIIFLIVLVVLFIINPNVNEQNKKEKQNNMEKFEQLEDVVTNLEVQKMDTNICSKQCCKFTQWPVPFNTQNPNVNPDLLKKFIGTNLSCNYGPDGGGCLCMTKDNFNYLANHGQSVDSKYYNPSPEEVKQTINDSYLMSLSQQF